MSAHARAQALRFLRFFAMALLTAYLAAGDQVSLRTLAALIPPALEVALRHVNRVEPAPAVTSEPAPPGMP